MTEGFPPRLTDASSGTPAALRELLESARREALDASAVASTTARIVEHVAAAGVLGSGGEPLAVGKTAWTAKLLVGLAVAGAVAVAAGVILRAHPSAAPSSAPTLAPAPDTTSESFEAPVGPSAAPAQEPASPASAPTAASPTPAAAKPSASASARPASLAEELERVRAIRARMLAGDAPGALAAVGDYERRFPRGTFLPEAEAMAVEALANAGRNDEARARADRFLATFPGSPQAARIRALRDKLARSQETP